VGSSPTGVALSTTTVKLAVDFKTRRATMSFNKYVGTAKARMRNIGSSVLTFVANSRWLDVASGNQFYLG